MKAKRSEKRRARKLEHAIIQLVCHTSLKYHTTSHLRTMEASQNSHPPPVVGEDEDRPGYWAQSARQNPWTRGRRVRQQQGTLLYALQSHTLCSEPAIRMPRNGDDFYYTIGTKTVNIEALLVQSTGKKIPVDEECESCQRSQGPFTSCVVAADLRHLMPTCANCHWGMGKSCSFITRPPTTHAATSQPGPPVPPTTLAEIEEALKQEILARDSVRAVLRGHDQRIQELQAMKDALQNVQHEGRFDN